MFCKYLFLVCLMIPRSWLLWLTTPERYFLLQATLIPIHCLRRNPTHADATSWRDSILTALSIINAMNNLNPSAPKCRDIIYRLCGESLNLKQRTQSQSQSQQDNTAGTPWPSSYSADTSYGGNPFSFQNPDSGDTSGLNSWMTEVDTAIDGYDIYCDRLSNAAMAGMGRMPSTGEGGVPGGFVNSDGTQIGTGVQDWDWGLML